MVLFNHLPFKTANPFPQSLLRQGDAYSVATVPRNTYPATALLIAIPTVAHATYTELTPLIPGKANLVRGIVTPKIIHLAVIKDLHAIEANTYAPSAVPLHTMLNNVTVLHNLLTIKTPFIPDQWEHLLNSITPFNTFPDVPIGMHFGFDMGVHLPYCIHILLLTTIQPFLFPTMFYPISALNSPLAVTLAPSFALD